MRCPICNEIMGEDLNFESITSEPNWRTKKGIKFDCYEHAYTTNIIFETNSELIKLILRNNNNFINKILMLFLNYEYTESGILEKKFRR